MNWSFFLSLLHISNASQQRRSQESWNWYFAVHNYFHHVVRISTKKKDCFESQQMLGIIRSESVSMPMILQLLHNRNRLSFFSTIDIPTACMWAEQGLYLARLVRQQTTEKKTSEQESAKWTNQTLDSKRENRLKVNNFSFWWQPKKKTFSILLLAPSCNPSAHTTRHFAIFLSFARRFVVKYKNNFRLSFFPLSNHHPVWCVEAQRARARNYDIRNQFSMSVDVVSC